MHWPAPWCTSQIIPVWGELYLFWPAEIICIQRQYLKQFSCQITVSDPGNSPIFRTTHYPRNNGTGRASQILTEQNLNISLCLFCCFLTRAVCWVHYNHNYSSLFPWARLPWVNKFSTWTNTPDRPHPRVLLALLALLESGDIVMMTMQTTQIGLTRSLSVYWETRGLEQENTSTRRTPLTCSLSDWRRLRGTRGAGAGDIHQLTALWLNVPLFGRPAQVVK